MTEHDWISSRREFLTLGAAAGAMLVPAVHVALAGTPQRLRAAVIGCGSQGRSHIGSLRELPDVDLVAVCDVDSERLAKAVMEAHGAAGVGDLRQILEDKSIDAVTIATPDHWHAPAALLAIEAGKHVYVEKPFAHNIRESQLLLSAARQRDRVVQHGTQSRSSAGIQAAMRLLHDGMIGDVLSAECWNWQKRKSIGHGHPSEPPATVDYDTWVGPAEMVPFQANRFHYDWHWWYNFGCGDCGNDGIHEIDLALWGLGVDTHPSAVTSLGGKYYFDDDQQFPDTQHAILEFRAPPPSDARKMLVYAQRLWSTNAPFSVDSGVEFHGTKGRLFLTKRGNFELFDERNRPLAAPSVGEIRVSVADHQRNWIDAIRGGARPDVAIAHRAATVVHLINIATRLCRAVHFDPAAEQVLDDPEATALLGRSYRDAGHWAKPAGIA